MPYCYVFFVLFLDSYRKEKKSLADKILFLVSIESIMFGNILLPARKLVNSDSLAVIIIIKCGSWFYHQ